MTAATEIEALLKSMFPSGHPVLCSSGRSALSLALIESGASRGDLVGVFPYASHCVLDVVSRITTPLAGPSSLKASARIVYHQWGYVQETMLVNNLIDDCVDTLCVPGAALFPGGGRFEIWSLPKIIGTTSGGVLWCKNEETANELRSLRDSRSGGLFQWIIRLLIPFFRKLYLFWHAAECEGGKVSRFQSGEILLAIQKWPDFVSRRQSYLEKIWPLAVDWLEKPWQRLPTVVPVDIALAENKLKKLGVLSGSRMFECVAVGGLREVKKVVPIPIHQYVSESWLTTVVKELTS
mgnify:CR=1 FL=1